MKTISYALTVCDEYKEIQELVDFLLKRKQDCDEIVVLVDENRCTDEIKDFLEDTAHMRISEDYNDMDIWYRKFDNDFAEHKNFLNSKCSKDFIFQIDADEIPSDGLMEALPMVLEENDVDCIAVPRWNTVEGITDEHIQKWGWNLDYQNRVNWPDYQLRVYKNTDDIKWDGKVHEKPVGYTKLTAFPKTIDYLCLHHNKTIERQEKQNSLYETI